MRQPRPGLTQAQAERFARALKDVPSFEPFEPNAYIFRQPPPLELEWKPIPPALATADALFAVFRMRREGEWPENFHSVDSPFKEGDVLWDNSRSKATVGQVYGVIPLDGDDS